MASLTTKSFFRTLAEGIVLAATFAASSKRRSKKTMASNQQCVKLTKEHTDVITAVTFWCDVHLNRLKLAGADAKVITNHTQRGARFLTALSHAIATQKDKEPDYDAWLFFDSDVKTTSYFELTQCERGTKDVMSSLIIRCDR